MGARLQIVDGADGNTTEAAAKPNKTKGMAIR